MLSYAVNDQFHNQKGNIESILYVHHDSVLLNEIDEDGEATSKLLTKAIFEKKLSEHRYLPKLIEKPHVQLTEFQERSRDHRLLYLSCLKQLVADGHKPTVRSTYDKMIQQVELVHPFTLASKHLAYKTICRHWHSWRKNNFNDDAVACRTRSSKGSSRLSPASEAVLNDYISGVFSDSTSRFITGHYNAYRNTVKTQHKNNNAVTVASERTFRRRLASMQEHETEMNSPHLSQADRNQRLLTLCRKIKTYYSLQRVECDALSLNMCLIDDETGRPTDPIKLYIAFDVFTRAPLAVTLGFGSENKEDVLNLLRHMFLSDNNLIAAGRPNVLIMDNGPGFNNKLVQKTCERLGISLFYAPSNQPAKKPFVEKFNHFLRQHFFSGVSVSESSPEDNKPGKKTVGFNSYYPKRTAKSNRSVDNLASSADIKISDFKRLLNQFLTEYMHKINAQTNQTPQQRWLDSARNTPRPHFSYDAVATAFHVALDTYSGNTNKLQSNGSVQCNKQRYASEDSKQLYNRLKTIGIAGSSVDVQVSVDPWDARKVTISAQAESQGKFIDVIANHVKFGDEASPISFDHINNIKSKSEGILQTTKYQITGEYAFHIPYFVKTKKSKAPRGRKITSFEDNNGNGLSAEERIEAANETNSHLTTAININHTEKRPKTTRRQLNAKLAKYDKEAIEPSVGQSGEDDEEALW
jgi:putative transposase